MVNRGDANYETRNYVYNFQQIETITSFTKNFFAGKIQVFCWLG